jgi:hypothetical protein
VRGMAHPLLPHSSMKRRHTEYLDRRRPSKRFDWLLSFASFILFLCVQTLVLGSYFHWLSKTVK